MGHLAPQVLGLGNGLRGTRRHTTCYTGTHSFTQQPGKRGARLGRGEEAHRINTKAGNQRRVICRCSPSHPILTVPIEQPTEDNTSSESDEEVEFAKTERDDDRRKTLLNSIQAGDSSLDQLKQQSKLKDHTDFFHLPDNSREGDPTTPRDSPRSTGASPTVSGEVIDLSLGTDDEGAENASTTTGSAPLGSCDIQRTITSAPATCRPHGPSNGKWTCPICTLYAPFSYFAFPSVPSPHPPRTSLHFTVSIFIPSIPHHRRLIDRRYFFSLAGTINPGTSAAMPVEVFDLQICELGGHSHER